MKDQSSVEYEYSEQVGTYQTGPFKHGRGQSVLITVLLMCVILLGGICSVLGIMNIRLLSRLVAQEQDGVSLFVDTSSIETYDDGFFHGEQVQTAKLPENDVLESRLGAQVEQINTLMRKYWGVSCGLHVISVCSDGCPLQEGDILTSINGEPLRETAQLYNIIYCAQSGQTLSFRLLRAGQMMDIDVTITK